MQKQSNTASGRIKLTPIKDRLTTLSGRWAMAPDQIDISNVRKTDIYRAPMEPSYVCWAILWKEADGALKLTFTETTGTPALWPPTYKFNNQPFDWYRKTLVSHDGGETWADTGWKEPLDPYWDLNSHHRGYHVIRMQDGSLLRVNPHGVRDAVRKMDWMVYDESKAMQDFPFGMEESEVHQVFTAFQTSLDKGRTWQEIFLNRAEPRFWSCAVHQLKNGSLVATGGNGIQNDGTSGESTQIVLSESWDGGKTWCPMQVLLENEDVLAPIGACEENDFVELADGRLLLIQRGAGIGMYQLYLTRDESGKWTASKPITFPEFVHSGYPYMHRASDGVVFYYDDTAIRYSCDDGASWNSLPLGFAYYGQLLEVSLGRILAMTQKNMGDCPYPWKHDTTMLQTTFDYERISVVEQTNPDGAAVGAIDGQDYTDFHAYADVRADGETGLVFDLDGDSYGFAAVVIPCNEFRAPGRAARAEQDAALVIGKCESGKISVSRRVGIGKVVPGAWVEMQLDRSGEILKAAVKAREGDHTNGQIPATYLVAESAPRSCGKLGFFTNNSTGAFKNVRICPESAEIRSNWRSPDEGARRIALDAGKQE